jgi:hypothetical protein
LYPPAHSATSPRRKTPPFSRGRAVRGRATSTERKVHLANPEDAFNLSCKYPVLKKEFQSENERDTAAFNRTSDKAEIKHLAGLLGASVGSR